MSVLEQAGIISYPSSQEIIETIIGYTDPLIASVYSTHDGNYHLILLTPTILFSGSNVPSSILAFHQAGIDLYMVKARSTGTSDCPFALDAPSHEINIPHIVEDAEYDGLDQE